MTKAEFKQLVAKMVNEYGVRSYLDNDEEDDFWFETPCCCDIIYYEDIDDEWAAMLKEGRCPICDNPFDEE